MECLKMSTITLFLSKSIDLPYASKDKFENMPMIIEYIENHTNYSIFNYALTELQTVNLIAKGKKITDIYEFGCAMSNDGIGEYNQSTIKVYVTE